jgi:hypothetical protein
MSRALRSSLPPWALLLLALGALSCRARRELHIHTSPTGAQVRLDDDLLPGTTPIEHDFEHYGVRQATFYLEDYRARSERIVLRKPWWAHFPLDLVTEVLLPFGWRDRTTVQVVLEPELGETSPQEIEAVLRRAESLRRAGPSGPRPVPGEVVTPAPLEVEGESR